MTGYAKSLTRVYGRLEGKRGKMCEGGLDREGMEPVEYCDSRFLEAYDNGRGSVLLRDGGDVMRGGRAGWLGFAAGEPMGGGEVAGLEPGDMIAVILKTD